MKKIQSILLVILFFIISLFLSVKYYQSIGIISELESRKYDTIVDTFFIKQQRLEPLIIEINTKFELKLKSSLIYDSLRQTLQPNESIFADTVIMDGFLVPFWVRGSKVRDITFEGLKTIRKTPTMTITEIEYKERGHLYAYACLSKDWQSVGLLYQSRKKLGIGIGYGSGLELKITYKLW